MDLTKYKLAFSALTALLSDENVISITADKFLGETDCKIYLYYAKGVNPDLTEESKGGVIKNELIIADGCRLIWFTKKEAEPHA